MDTDENVRPVFPGDHEPLLEGDVIVTVAGQKGAVTWSSVQYTAQLSADREDHILFVGPSPADRSHRLSSVAGIDHDDPVFPGNLDLLTRLTLLPGDIRQNDIDDDPVTAYPEISSA